MSYSQAINLMRGCSLRQPKHNDVADADLTYILSTGPYADVTIVVADTKYRVHCEFPSERSSRFHAMFESPMKESRADEMVLGDVEPSTFDIILRSIYKGETVMPQGEAVDLIDVVEAATRFGTTFNKEDLWWELVWAVNEHNVLRTLRAVKCCGGPNVVLKTCRGILVQRHAAIVQKQGTVYEQEDLQELVDVLKGLPPYLIEFKPL